MQNDKVQRITATGENSPADKPKSGKLKSVPKTPVKVQQLDSPIKP